MPNDKITHTLAGAATASGAAAGAATKKGRKNETPTHRRLAASLQVFERADCCAAGAARCGLYVSASNSSVFPRRVGEMVCAGDYRRQGAAPNH